MSHRGQPREFRPISAYLYSPLSLVLSRKSLHSGRWANGSIGKQSKLQPGDLVWIGKNRSRLEVRVFFPVIVGPLTLQPHLRGDRLHLVGRDFIWLSWLSRVVS